MPCPCPVHLWILSHVHQSIRSLSSHVHHASLPPCLIHLGIPSPPCHGHLWCLLLLLLYINVGTSFPPYHVHVLIPMCIFYSFTCTYLMPSTPCNVHLCIHFPPCNVLLWMPSAPYLVYLGVPNSPCHRYLWYIWLFHMYNNFYLFKLIIYTYR